MTSFENTKSEIVSSGLGQAIGLTVSNTWAQIVTKIKAIINRGALNWSGSNTTKVVDAGYYTGGTLDSRPSYNAGVSAADNRVNTNSQSYKSGYNAGVSDGQSTYGLKTKTGSMTTATGSPVTIACGFTPVAFFAWSTSGVQGMLAARKDFHQIMNSGSTTIRDDSGSSTNVITFSGTNVVITTNNSAFNGKAWNYSIIGS